MTSTLSYRDNSDISVSLGSDNLAFGSGVCLGSHPLGLARMLSPKLRNTTADGLLGLSLKALSAEYSDIRLFSLMLGDCDSDIGDNGGGTSYGRQEMKSTPFLTINEIDDELVTTWSPVLGDDRVLWSPIIEPASGMWQIESASLIIGGCASDLAGTAVIDSGTSLLLVPPEVCRRVYAAIPGSRYDKASEGWVFPATLDAEKLPIMVIRVGIGHDVTLSKKSLTFAQTSDGSIFGGIQSRGRSVFNIFGIVFLQAIYAVSNLA